MLCKKCGTENNEGTKFCKKCGNLLNEGTNLCKKCGTENNEGTAFCKKCGNPLNNGNAKKSVSYTENKSNWYKTKRNKILTGVCAGLAEKWNINPWILRIILIVTNFFVIGWFLDIAYIILVFTLKYDDEDSFVKPDNTPDTPTKTSRVLPEKSKIEKQRKTRKIENEESEELFNNSESAKKTISPKSAPEPSTEEEYEELFSYSEPAEKNVSVHNTKKEKSHKIPRLSTIILAVLLAVVVFALGLFVFLYFNKDNNNTDLEKKQNSIPAVTETSSEKETEVSTTEAETETEVETETETEIETEEETEDNTEYFDDIETDDKFVEYTTRLYKGLSYYQLPDYSSKINGKITKTTIYTIVDEKYDEVGYLWGKLKSGVGWVNLNDNDWLRESQE